MEQSLINLKNKLKKDGFKFESSISVYNPMERFAEYVSTKEIVHSKIIADLLNPVGEHQLRDCFLINFLNQIGCFEISTTSSPYAENHLRNVVVDTEFFAPTEVSNGRIDILVRFVFNNKSYALIIENKLNDACDQPDQLKRYNDYVEKELGYDADQRITVYIPRIGDKCKDYPQSVVINATDLAMIIDKTLQESVSPNKAAIQAYSNYLKNISKRNIIMDNAKILEGLTAIDIQQAKSIKEAYDRLPEAFAESLCRTYKKNGYEAQLASNYPNYCYIWDKKAYTNTSLWLAVGFSHDACYFYIVSNDKATYNRYSTKLKVAESSKSYGNFWLKPIEESYSSIKFEGKPDTGKLSEVINYWLRRLNQVAKLSLNNEDSPSL